MTTKELEKQFISQIADELFKKDNDRETDNEVLFRLRFSRDNYELPNQKDTAEKDINKFMESAGFKGKNIQRILRFVINLILDKYSEDMSGDISEKELNDLKNTERGKGNIWQIVFKWLWDYKFPQWQIGWIWENLQSQAKISPNWLNFVPTGTDRAMAFNKDKLKEKLQVNQKYDLKVDLPKEAYLVLLNRGLDTRYLVCPSLAFAPEYKIVESPIWLPQNQALANEDKIYFDAPGKEEYLAILLEKPLDIDWLKPSVSDPFPNWQSNEIIQLWEALAKENNWQVYYRQVEVVG
ncbi:MAG: hypothetical protein F6K39_22330 [Okeania sp. SIO3B3]|nr:hypothetical protein [Okeania sp. SIO3B3]